jgi:DNA-directed RNA polymerase
MKRVGIRTKHSYLKSNIDKNVANPTVFLEADFQNIRKALINSIFVDHKKLDFLVKYLKCVVNIANTLKIPIPWTLPTGLVVNQQYYATKNIKVKPFAYTKNLLNLTIKDKDNFNELKQKAALMPNLVHSLDATILINFQKMKITKKTSILSMIVLQFLVIK